MRRKGGDRRRGAEPTRADGAAPSQRGRCDHRSWRLGRANAPTPRRPCPRLGARAPLLTARAIRADLAADVPEPELIDESCPRRTQPSRPC